MNTIHRNFDKVQSTNSNFMNLGTYKYTYLVDRINLATADPQISWRNLSLSIKHMYIIQKSRLDLLRSRIDLQIILEKNK